MGEETGSTRNKHKRLDYEKPWVSELSSSIEVCELLWRNRGQNTPTQTYTYLHTNTPWTQNFPLWKLPTCNRRSYFDEGVWGAEAKRNLDVHVQPYSQLLSSGHHVSPLLPSPVQTPWLAQSGLYFLQWGEFELRLRLNFEPAWKLRELLLQCNWERENCWNYYKNRELTCHKRSAEHCI